MNLFQLIHPSNPIIQPQIKQTSPETSIDLHATFKGVQEKEMREILTLKRKSHQKYLLIRNKVLGKKLKKDWGLVGESSQTHLPHP